MEGKKNVNDHLNYLNNYTIKNNITREEEILFTDKISKINKYGWSQERNIIITNKAIYNLKKTKQKRRIDFKTIIGITFSKVSDEFVIHCSNIDYDYQYKSKNRNIIIEIMAQCYQDIKEEELKIIEMPNKSLSDYVTTKKEKEKNKNSRMPQKESITLQEYLSFGQSKINNKSFSHNPSVKINFNFQNIQVSSSDFKIIKIIGRGSVGKIALVKFNSDQKYYVMKSMRKDQIISEDLIDNIVLEKKILMDGGCVFILSLSFFYQTPERIYFVCPFIRGGDLFHKLKTDGFLKEELVRFYAAQIAIALQYLHDLNIVYRDLKPENILIDEDGYIKLCDFGASKTLKPNEKADDFAGSPEYSSPEMITFEGHTFMTDWWSFGILIYELLYGNTPFFNMDKNRMYELIKNGSISYPKCIELDGEESARTYKISDDAKNLINKLLEKNPDFRFGKKGLNEIKKHPFFGGINFEDLKKKKVKVTFKPEIDKDDPTNNFDEEYLTMDISESPVSEWSKESEYNNWFYKLTSQDNGI